MRLIPALLLASCLLFPSLSNAESVLIDNFTDTSFGPTTVYTDVANSYSVERTITNTSNFSAFGDGFQAFDFGVARFGTVAQFDYTTNGAYTFGDIWDAAVSGDTINYPVDNVSFGYTAQSVTPGDSNYTVQVRGLNGTSELYNSGDLDLNFGPGQTFSLYDYIGLSGAPALDNATDIELIFKRVSTVVDGQLILSNGFSIVPEPTAALLFGSALLGFSVRRRR